MNITLAAGMVPLSPRQGSVNTYAAMAATTDVTSSWTSPAASQSRVRGDGAARAGRRVSVPVDNAESIV